MVQAASAGNASEKLVRLGANTPQNASLQGSGNPNANVGKKLSRKRDPAGVSTSAQLDLFKLP
jgi:hypothetical protein